MSRAPVFPLKQKTRIVLPILTGERPGSTRSPSRARALEAGSSSRRIGPGTCGQGQERVVLGA